MKSFQTRPPTVNTHVNTNVNANVNANANITYMNQDNLLSDPTDSEIFPISNPNGVSTEMEFKKLLFNFSKENEVLKEKVQNYEKRLVNYSTEIQELHKQVKQITLDRDHLKGISQKFQDELEDKDRILNISLSPLKKGRTQDFETEHDYVESDIINMIDSNVEDKLVREALRSHFEKLEYISSKHDDLKGIVKKLQEENKILRKKVEMFETEKIQIRLCAFCKDYYTPLNNSDTACQHHPGKLKYYSCRGCGGDEYYTCCNLCTKCKKGCKESKHVPMN